MAKIYSYKELIVWQKAIILVKEAYITLDEMPAEEKYNLTQQMKRSVVSIPANIAEGWGRKSRKSYVHFLRISSGSLYEFETFLIIAMELGFIELKKAEKLNSMLDELARMLSSMILKLEAKDIVTKD